MARWVCYIAAVVVTFTATLVWLSCITGEPGLDLGEIEVQQFSQAEWDGFLLRRSLQIPTLNSSLEPWEEFEPEGDYLQAEFPALVQYPLLPYDDGIACLPRKFGYSQEQADSLFSPNRRYPPCGNPAASTLHLDQK